MIILVKRLLKERRAEIIRIVRFSIVGVINTLVFASIFYAMYRFAKIHYLISTTSAYALATINSFLINRTWTFDSRANSKKKFVKFVLINVLSAGINSLLMYLFVDKVGFNVLLSQAVTILVTMCVNYIGNRMWTFRDVCSEG